MNYLFAEMMARSKPEDMLTEMLAFLLREDEAFRRVLAARIWPDDDLDPGVEVTTQVGCLDDGRVDLEWRARQGLCIVEAKIWAPFTDGQPLAYVKTLAASGTIQPVLLLIGPERRREEIQREVQQRLQGADFLVTWKGPEASAGSTRLLWLSWKKVLEALGGDPVIERLRVYRHEFRHAVGSRAEYQYGEVPVDVGDRSFGKFLRDMTELVYQVQARLVQQGIDAGSCAGGAEGGVYYGFYLPGARGRLWFGLWSRPWDELGKGPLWIQGKGRAAEWLGGEPGARPLGSGHKVLPVALVSDDLAEAEGYVAATVAGIAGRFAAGA
jgi:hypothetical protein